MAIFISNPVLARGRCISARGPSDLIYSDREYTCTMRYKIAML